MKVVTCHGSKDVRVEQVSDPTLLGDSDVSFRVTAAAICGSDLHSHLGSVSLPGLYADTIHPFLSGDAFDKGLIIAMGQTHVQHAQQHMPMLPDHIGEGRLDPGLAISHRLPLSHAAAGYTTFDKKDDDCRKAVLTPD